MTTKLFSGACIVHNNKVLIIKQPPRADQPGKWGPPGGHAEEGETTEETAIREIFEETGLKISITGIVKIAYFTDIDALVIYYKAKVKNSKNIRVNSEEVSEYRWLTSTQLRNNKLVFRSKKMRDVMIESLTSTAADKNCLILDQKNN